MLYDDLFLEKNQSSFIKTNLAFKNVSFRLIGNLILNIHTLYSHLIILKVHEYP